MRDLDDDLALAARLADAARAAILPWFRAEGLASDNKKADEGAFDPVTQGDRAAEAAIRRILDAERPQDAIYGEEYGRKPGTSGFEWILDPIDGTRAFMSGLLHWGVLIGLYHEGRPVLGLMDQPYVGERFYARAGGGSFQEKGGARRRIRARACAELEAATLLTTDARIFDRTPGERPAYDAIQARVRLARYGSDCYGYAMIAAGQADLVIESGLSAYDVAALIPILTEAGALMTDWNGESCAHGGRVLAAGDARLHAAALAGVKL